MRLLQLLTQERGGPVDHAVDVACELAARGHDSHVVGPLGAHATRLAEAGVTLHEVDYPHLRDLAGARAVHRAVAAVRPDVVHLQDRRAGLLGRALATGRRMPAVYTLHGVPDPFAHLVRGNLPAAPPAPLTRVTNMLAEGTLARAPRSLMVTPCEAVAAYAREHLRVPHHRVRAVANGVAPHWLAPLPTRTERPDDELVVVWLGVLAPVKRVPALVRALADAPGVRLRLVGDGPERAAVEAAAERAGVTDRVELLGHRHDPAAELDRADVLALPSAAEACPMAVLQGMARGLPVVASRAGGIPEVVRDGRDGLLVRTGDDRALAAALVRLRDDRALRRCLGAEARHRVERTFTIGHCATELEQIYGDLAAARPTAGRAGDRSIPDHLEAHR